MTRRLLTGFEGGHIGIADSIVKSVIGGESIDVATDQKKTGNYSLKSVQPWSGMQTKAEAIFDLGVNCTEVYVRLYFRTAQLVGGSGPEGIFGVQDSGGNCQLMVSYNNTNAFRVDRGGPGGSLVGSGGVVTINAWRLLELRAIIHASAGVCQLKVDGTIVVDFTGWTQSGGTTNTRRIEVGCYANGITLAATHWYDDIAVNDALGSVNNSWIGPSGIYGFTPNGAGTYTDLTRGGVDTGANYSQVNIIPPLDASYVQESNVDKKDSYALTNSPVSGLVKAIQWEARASQDIAGTANIARLLRIGGSDRQGSDVPITTTFKGYREVLETKPVVGGAFSTGDLDSMEAGAVVR